MPYLKGKMKLIGLNDKENQTCLWENIKNNFITQNIDVNTKIYLKTGGYKTILGLAIENKDDSFIKTLLKNEKLDVNAYVYYKEKPYHIHVSNALQYASKFYTVDSEITKLLSNKMKNTSDLLYFSK